MLEEQFCVEPDQVSLQKRYCFCKYIPSNFGMGDRLEAFLRAERMQGSMHRGKSRRHTLQLGQLPSLESNAESGCEQTPERLETPSLATETQVQVRATRVQDFRHTTAEAAKLAAKDYAMNGQRALATHRGFVGPRWELDEEASDCRLCARSFHLFFRRHHCRHCGLIFCGDCCSQQLLLPYSTAH